MCVQRRLRSAWASAKSDQSLCCPHEESLGPWLPIERTAKTLIRLGGCQGWTESSRCAHPHCWVCHEAAHLSYPRKPNTKKEAYTMMTLFVRKYFKYSIQAMQNKFISALILAYRYYRYRQSNEVHKHNRSFHGYSHTFHHSDMGFQCIRFHLQNSKTDLDRQ